MEVSIEIKELIRKTQCDLKNAIRIHQVWVARLQDDENNIHLKTKVKEAEKEIIESGLAQKSVVDRLRRELELYQQGLKQRNKPVNIDSDNKYVATQLRDHLLQYRSRNRSVSLLKPSVLNELHIKSDNNSDEAKENIMSDSDIEHISDNEKEYSNNSETSENDNERNYSQLSNSVHGSRSKFVNALKKVKESLSGSKLTQSYEHSNEWQRQKFDSDSSSCPDLSPTPSPPPLPEPGQPISKEIFLRLIGLVTPYQRELFEKKRNERRKRSRKSANRNNFLYGDYELLPKKKKYNQFSYLQTHSDPPQTRSAKLRKQQGDQGPKHQNQDKSSREGSPSGSSTENNKSWTNGKPAWAACLPASLSVEPVYAHNHKKNCHVCGRNDVTSLLVRCSSCREWQHTGCGADSRCVSCGGSLPEPAPSRLPDPSPDLEPLDLILTEKYAERKRLQETNIKLCDELRKLEARAVNLKENLDEHNAEKRQLLADQIKTQRNLQKLLGVISQFKETSITIRSPSVSESSSEVSKSNEE